MHTPRIIISGLSGGAGKTLVSLGLARAFSQKGLRVRAFKKGPDYIDAAWLAMAAGTLQANLDPFFTPGKALIDIFSKGSAGYDLAIIEGNRGLFDGLDISGSCSTAEVARSLNAPVLLVLDCTKMTRTAAAVVKGCADFEPGVHIGGVILNRTGNPRHQSVVRRAVEELAGVPVLGILPRKNDELLAERHMGLAGLDECSHALEHLDGLADFISSHVDMSGILSLAKSPINNDDSSSESSFYLSTNQAIQSSTEIISAKTGIVTVSSGPSSLTAIPPVVSCEVSEPVACSGKNSASEAADTAQPLLKAHAPDITNMVSSNSVKANIAKKRPLIGYIRDEALWFYYQENLTALETAGADLVPLSLLDECPWPTLNGLYLGGGLPELHAARLSGNTRRREQVAQLSKSGLPIYAECGGFMYLSRTLEIHGSVHPMADVFSCEIEFCERPQGLGYVEAEVVASTPFYPVGTRFRGHEFHFSRIAAGIPSLEQPVLILSKGQGMGPAQAGGCVDGLMVNNTFASYTHIYAPAVPQWAISFTALCNSYFGSYNP